MADVTVVVPFWNLEESILEECITSVRTQNEACDILIVDNFSDKPVPAIEGTEVLRLEERVSVGEARNIGLHHVTTPFVMFMDADDVLLPGAVAHLMRLARSRPGVALAAGGIEDWICETGYRNGKCWPSPVAHKLNRRQRLFRAANAFRNMTPVTGCAVLDTKMAKTTGGFPDSTAEDWTFGVSMGMRGHVILSTQKVKLYRWRADGLSKTAVRDIKALWEARCVTRKAIANDSMAPAWMRSTLPVMAVLHAIELPFHVRREKRFSDARLIGMEQTTEKAPTPIKTPVVPARVKEAADLKKVAPDLKNVTPIGVSARVV